MGDLLSDAWFERLADRLAPVTSATRLAVGVEVRGDETFEYQVRLGPTGATVDRSPAEAPDLTLVLDEASARALAAGRINAQRLLLEGRLKLRGDPLLLLGVEPSQPPAPPSPGPAGHAAHDERSP